MPPSLNVFWKELLSFFRDRRTVFNQIVFPVALMPLLMYAPTYLVVRLGSQAGAEVQRVAVTGAPDQLVRALVAEKLKVVPGTDPEREVRDGRAEAGLVWQGERVRVFLRKSQEGFKAEVVQAKIERALEAYKRARVVAALRAAGLDPGVLEPFRTEFVDVSPKAAQQAGALGFLVPMFLLMFILSGAMPVVNDATAGEKERGTLEVLLATPAPPFAILLGKAGSAMVAALLSTVSGVAGLALGGLLMVRYAGGSLAGPGGEGLAFSLSPGALGVILVTGVLFAAFAVGVMLLLGLFAKSYKEAQTYMGFLYMVLVLPAVILGMASSFLGGNPIYDLIPVVGPLLLVDSALRAKADGLDYLLAWGSTALYALLALWLATRAFVREEVVFRN